MSFAQATDKQILQLLEEGKGIEDDMIWGDYTINDTFFIKLTAGKEGYSEPAETYAFWANYKRVTIGLYYWQPMPPKEELHIDPIEFSTPEMTYKFTFDVQCFPHRAIDLQNDEIFRNQPWASEFRGGTGFSYTAMLDWPTVCEILRYCDKMSRLKAFW